MDEHLSDQDFRNLRPGDKVQALDRFSYLNGITYTVRDIQGQQVFLVRDGRPKELNYLMQYEIAPQRIRRNWMETWKK